MHPQLGSTEDQRDQLMVSRAAVDIRALIFVSVLCAAGVMIWRHSLLHTARIALKVDAYTHILLVLPVSLLLLLSVRRRQPWRPAPAIRLGLSLLSLSMLVATGASGLRSTAGAAVDLHLSFEMLAFVIWLVGSFVLCFGKAIARICIFPLLFLLWLVPLPDAALNYIIHFLQEGTTSCAYAMLTAVGVPAIKNGTTLSIPGLTLQIVEECSSIRSSMMLIVSSMVMSYLLLRSYWARGIAVLAALPLAILKNGLRVLTLALLGAYVNPEILDSPLHRQGGPLFLAISLLGMFALIWLMAKAEKRTYGVTMLASSVPQS